MKCNDCKLDKPEDCFWKDKKSPTGRQRGCKDCKGVHYQMHQIKRTYGISISTYYDMLAYQSGKCAICGTFNPDKCGKRSMFAIDHDHVTGKVRGLLCCECNLGIGQLGDDIERLKAAASYLEKHK